MALWGVYVQIVLVRGKCEQTVELLSDDRTQLGPLLGRLFAHQIDEVRILNFEHEMKHINCLYFRAQNAHKFCRDHGSDQLFSGGHPSALSRPQRVHCAARQQTHRTATSRRGANHQC